MDETEFNLSLLDLVLFPVTLPVKGFVLVLQQLKEMADRELYDERALRQKMLELDLAHELGYVDEPDYRRRRLEMTERLRVLAGTGERTARATSPGASGRGGAG